MKYGLVATLTSFAAVANAVTTTVQVGQGGLMYVPESVTAAAGDVINFVWASNGHSVVQSAGTTTSDACQPMMGGFATSVLNSGATYMLPVNSSDPVYIHCGPHCKSAGMVFVINPPSQAAVTSFMDAAEGKMDSSSSSAAPASTSSAASSSSDAMSLSMPSFTILGALAVSALLGSAIVF